MIEIIEIPYLETFAVRHPVLRQGKPIETCFFDGDDLPTTKHFGLFVNKKIAGVISVFKNNNTTFIAENQSQIRGMAVLNEFQKKGFGNQLMKHSESYILKEECNLIWFNAREIAVDFYKKLGYVETGNSFEIGDIGNHYLMYKKLG